MSAAAYMRKNIHRRVFPAWFPPSLAAALPAGRLRVRFRPSRPERSAMRKRKPVPPSVWAERHRVVTNGPMAGSRWSNEVTPYLAGIMDASFLPGVQTIVVCKSPQVGGSTALDTCLGYVADRCPGPALIVYPDRNTARENATDRIQPMFRQSRQLSRLMTGADEDVTAQRIKLRTMLIYMGWAGSIQALGNKTIKYLFLDELDKYENRSSREAPPERLAEKRVIAYPLDHKIWKISTPTVERGPIWQALTVEAQAVFVWAARCPDCGRAQVMNFDNITWPGGGDADPGEVEASSLARYACVHCGVLWTDYQRNRAVRAGEWVLGRRDEETGHWRSDSFEPMADAVARLRAKRIGFHIPAWLSPFVSLSEIAAAFLRSRHDRSALKDFCNGYKAEPWFDYTQDRRQDILARLRDTRPSGTVPGRGEVACLLAVADTQDNGFWFEVRAFGWGPTLPSWSVHSGFVDTKEALEEIFFLSDYRDADGNPYRVYAAGIDAMGHRTVEIYDFCRKHPGRLIPLKGEQRMSQPFAWTQIEHYPGSKRAIPGGLKMLRVNSKIYKDNLAAKLEISPADPGAWLFSSETSDEWINQLCAETIDETTGEWHNPRQRPNHAWDVSYNLLALADLYRVKLWPRPGSGPARNRAGAGKQKPARPNPYTGGNQIFGRDK